MGSGSGQTFDLELLARENLFREARIAQKCDLSPRQLRRYHAVRSRLPLRAWLNRLRMGEAVRQLLEGKMTKAVALDVGFKGPSPFCHAFRKVFGMTPRDYVRFLRANRKKGWSSFDPEI